MTRSRLEKFLPLAAIIIVSCLIIFLRETSIFLHPQFWGEDGKYWYGQAYSHGPLLTLFWSYAGSLQLAMRLVGSISTFLPFTIVPLFFALIAAVTQALPAILLMTPRYRQIFGSLKISLLLALFYLLIPNSYEVHANLTNVNWHLALLAFMVLAVPATSYRWQYFDYPTLVLTGFTGPFAVFLLPAAYLFWRKGLTKKSYVILLAACVVAQALAYILSNGGSRLSRALGANPVILLKIIGGRITAALFIGMDNAGKLIIAHHHLVAVLGGLTLALLAFVIWRGPLRLKIFVVFSWLTFFVALLKPQASLTVDQWPAILQGAGNRYFFLPMISLFVSLLWLASSKVKAVRYLAYGAIALIFAGGVIADFSYPPRSNQDFSASVKQFQRASRNQRVCLNVNPEPDWRTCLIKH